MGLVLHISKPQTPPKYTANQLHTLQEAVLLILGVGKKVTLSISSFLFDFSPTLLGCGSIWGGIDAPDALSMPCAYPAAFLFVLNPCIIPSILWALFCAAAC